jgi:Arc/MetJ-type ribon-helix-helix transcriptional regulator
MKKSISVNKKSRGRPKKKGGVYPVTAVRLSPALGAEVDSWADSQTDTPNRSEAIRRLVELGLTARTKAKQPPQARANRAKELATKAIEKVSDPAAPPEERAQRRRQLTKGPSEFREDRVDLPKAKGKV